MKVALSLLTSLLLAAAAFAQPKPPEIVVPVAHDGPIWAAAFSPDGSHVVTGSADGSVILWDAKTGQPLRRMVKHHRDVQFVGFLNGADQVFAAPYDDPIVVWDCATGAVVREIKATQRRALAYSRDGKRIFITKYPQNDVLLLDGMTGKNIRTLKAFAEGVHLAADVLVVSRDGSRLAAASEGAGWIAWKVETGERLASQPNGPERLSSAAAVFGADHKTLFVAESSAICRTDLSRPANFTRLDVKGFSIGVLDPTGRFALSGRPMARGATLLDSKEGSIQIIKGIERWAGACYSDDGSRLLIATYDEAEDFYPIHSRAIVWDTKAGKAVVTLKPPVRPVMLVRFVGTRLTVADKEEAGAEWDLAAGTAPVAKRVEGAWNSSFQASTPDGRLAVKSSMGLGSKAVLHAAEQTEPLRQFRVDDKQVHGCAISGDGKRVATTMSSGEVIVWDATNGTKLRALGLGDDQATALALSGDGKRVLTGTVEGNLIVWDADTGKQVQTIAGHTGQIFSVAMSPDATRLFSATGDGMTRIWDAAAGTEIARLVLLNEGKDWLVVAPDGRFDGSAEALKLVKYRADGKLKLEPIQNLAKDLHRPGLLKELWAKK